METTELVSRYLIAKDNMSKANLISLCKEYNRLTRSGVCTCQAKGCFLIVENWIKQAKLL